MQSDYISEKCCFFRPEYHVGFPEPANETTNVTPDFSFTLTNRRRIPNGIRHVFQGRQNERFAIIIHGWHASFVSGKYHINGKGIVK